MTVDHRDGRSPRYFVGCRGSRLLINGVSQVSGSNVSDPLRRNGYVWKTPWTVVFTGVWLPPKRLKWLNWPLKENNIFTQILFFTFFYVFLSSFFYFVPVVKGLDDN